MTNAQIAAVKLVLASVVDSVRAAGSQGAPGGVIYAALMAHGASLEQYEQIMAALVASGQLRRAGHLYFIA